MTAIVGLVDQGKVWMGADSVGSDGQHLMQRSDEKIFRRGPYLIGFTSSFRMGQLIRYRADLPEPYDWEHDLVAFMSTRFVDAIRECLQQYGFAKIDNNVQTGGVFLVGFRGAVYQIESDYQVGLRSCGWDAVGSGEQVALGSLHSTAVMKIGPEARIRMALEAAAELNAHVRGPFRIEVLA
jgi:ATP-dependent protease HslVU (ClpYQ) peptidase subunit